MAKVLDRLRTRTPTVGSFFRHALADPRNVQYDALPLLGSVRHRAFLAHLIRMALPRSVPFKPSDTALTHFDALNTHGYTSFLPLLDPTQVSGLLSYFKGQLCWDPWRAHFGDFPWDEPASEETNLAAYRIEQIVAAPGVLELLNHPLVLEVAELYLGCKPTLDNINCWWSYGGRAHAKGTQRFHRDWDNIRGFKLFVYLTDVDMESGPHSFIEGSHRADLLMETKALTDEAVFAAFGKDAERLFCGPAGTCFIADTFGIHKGELPRTRHRLMLAAQYNLTPSPHGPRRPVRMYRERRFDAYVNRIYVGE